MSAAATALWLTVALAVGTPLLWDPLGMALRWRRRVVAARAAEEERIAEPLPGPAAAASPVGTRPVTDQLLRMKWYARLDRAARRAAAEAGLSSDTVTEALPADVPWPRRVAPTDLARAYEATTPPGLAQPRYGGGYQGQHRLVTR